MREYKLYANVNPLAPNCMIEVHSSRKLCCGLKDAIKILKGHAISLHKKGYRCEIEEITKVFKIYDYERDNQESNNNSDVL
jgi:hypothetical protein